MKYILIVILVIVLSSCNSLPDKKNNSINFQEIHNQAIFIDTHNDILLQIMEKGYALDDDLIGKTHSDLARMKQGGLDAQFFSVWSDGDQKNPYDYASKQIESLDAAIKRNPDKIVKVANSEELLQAIQQNKIAALIGIEGGHQIEKFSQFECPL